MTKEEELTQYCSELLCPDYSNCDLCMYNRGRAEAIDECVALPTENIFGIEYIRKRDIEHLKEQIE